MTPKFQASVNQRDEVSYVKISGVIDEDNDLGGLAEKVTAPAAVINLSDIERINSCGVRDWVNWLGRIEKSGTRKIVLDECSPSIVAQINLVSNFTGPGAVRSFYAPYFCPNCDREKVLLVETRDAVGKQPYKAPTCRCDECDGIMDFDDMEESYFAFLGNPKKIDVDASVEAAISEFTPSSSGGKLRLRSGSTGPGSGGGAAQPTATPSSSSGGGGTHSSVSGSSSRPGLNGFSGKTGTGQSGQKWPTNPGFESQSRITAPLVEPTRSAGAWILVGVLVAAAIALLAYVFLSGKPAPTGPGATSSSSRPL